MWINPKRWGRGGLIFIGVGLFLSAGFFLLDHLFPLPQARISAGGSAVVTARDATPLRAFADQRGVWRHPVLPGEVSPLFIEALLGYEDRWFYHHPGVNPFSLLRAFWQWLDQGRVISGGSTLTMQVARLLDPHPRTLGGKLRQIFRALQLELHHSKTEILSHYLNLAPYGGPLEGVQAASYAYLGKSAETLSHAEAALLAVLPQAPSRLRPDRHPQRAQKARDKVLDRLGKFHIWEDQTIGEAKEERVVNLPFESPMTAPLLARRLKEAARKQGRLITTIDAPLQWHLESRLSGWIEGLPPGTSGAILVIDNEALQVRAYLGSAAFENDGRFGHVDMIQAKRSPGSTLKPFLYGFALDDGLIHSESLLVDAPQSFKGYRPGNFHGGFYGPVSVGEALHKSLNIPAVDVMDRLGPKRFVARLRNGGVKLEIPGSGQPSLAVILGGVGVSLEALVGGYAALARGGMSGRVRLTEATPSQERRMLSPGAAWIIRYILAKNPRPNESVIEVDGVSPRRLAWKTGTSYGFRDAWALGVTDRLTVGVWVGRPDGTPLPGHYGAVTAAPILFDVVDGLPARLLWGDPPQKPASVSERIICWPLGTLLKPTDHQRGLCHQQRSAWILAQTAPGTLPDRLEKVWRSNPLAYWINPESGLRVDEGCSVAKREARWLAFWPLGVHPWLSGDLIQKSTLPLRDPACPVGIDHHPAPLKLTGVENGSVLRRAGEGGEDPVVTLSALGGGERLYWLVNREMKQESRAGGMFRYVFRKPGGYEITVMDEAGRYDRVQIRVAP
ncbi:MAG: penicillin-binding protein 1C [Magnetococcales bacterium]|nr:penicillin-binding protein 1C [Magnetococcales bacterium]